jgi:hypothetical protein
LNKFDNNHNWIATTSRHYGHRVYFVGQRWSQFSPIIRANCSSVFTFDQPRIDIEKLELDYGVTLDKEIPRFNCYWLRNFHTPIKLHIENGRLQQGWKVLE